MVGPGFLDLPSRTVKPRGIGITHVLDKGLPLGYCADLLESGGAYVDVWKFGWGTSYLDQHLPAKLELLAQHRVLACPGGTLLEIAWAQGRAGAFFDWARAAGFPCVEVSAGTVPLTPAPKQDLRGGAASHCIVLSEGGAKDPAARMLPEQWGTAVSNDLAAGATWVLAEGRASGTVGLYHPSGAVREDIVAALTAEVDPGLIVFEAPREGQQAWFIAALAPPVNLATLPPPHPLALQPLRLSLRADTFAAGAPAPVPARGT